MGIGRYTFSTTASRPAPWLVYLTAFEKAMQDVYGDGWKDMLSGKQLKFVRNNENWRKHKLNPDQEGEMGGTTPARRLARDDEHQGAWHQKVELLRAKFLREKEARELGEALPPAHDEEYRAVRHSQVEAMKMKKKQLRESRKKKRPDQGQALTEEGVEGAEENTAP